MKMAERMTLLLLLEVYKIMRNFSAAYRRAVNLRFDVLSAFFSFIFHCGWGWNSWREYRVMRYLAWFHFQQSSAMLYCSRLLHPCFCFCHCRRRLVHSRVWASEAAEGILYNGYTGGRNQSLLSFFQIYIYRRNCCETLSSRYRKSDPPPLPPLLPSPISDTQSISYDKYLSRSNKRIMDEPLQKHSRHQFLSETRLANF